MLTEDLAHYVLALEDAAASATHVADRPAYEKYRAHAGLLLALALTDKDGDRLREQQARGSPAEDPRANRPRGRPGQGEFDLN